MALLFNGTTDWLDFGTDALLGAGSDFTIVMWVMPTFFTGVTNVFVQKGNELGIYKDPFGDIGITAGGASHTFSTGLLNNTPDWSVIAVAGDATGATGMNNSTLSTTSGDWRTGSDGSAALTVGAATSHANPFPGRLAQIAIWDVKLTDAELQSLRRFAPMLVRPSALRFYGEMSGRGTQEADWFGGKTATTAGTFAENPFVIRPSRTRVEYAPATQPPVPPPAPPSVTHHVRRLRQVTHVSTEGQRMLHERLQVDVQPGIGNTTGPGDDPTMMVQWSDNGGFTWSNEHWESAGAQGRYATRVQFYQLGEARDRVYRFWVSDPNVGWAVAGAFLDVRKANS